ncbi:MAG: hypothetical protein J0L76_19905 [Rhodobacterales bacterium]|nr:hypothetical protein [Rhodobacterales bacterium]
MTTILPVRPALPDEPLFRQPTPPDKRHAAAPPPGSTAAVGPLLTPRAVPPAAMKPAILAPSVQETPHNAASAAAAAAEAARDAYIKASIAAGINPLPVP